MQHQRLNKLFNRIGSQRRDERGEASFELVLAVPVFIVFEGLVMWIGALALGEQQTSGVVAVGPSTAILYNSQSKAFAAGNTAMQDLAK